ncbi:nucleotide 5'-monophosphate nucleosidase PpnN [Gallibacterium anatis]|uniref:AMP nucleosidase n=1 Tax=Gallibacterium genomosp. 1 TaxID=155515 RepID=A0A0A2Y900_9PAST|nr:MULTISPECIES: nucleotide 5'-monophosphate nucleosidase PpnN [Gallibacterium]KGQ39627.1 LOG family protein [Gallibacterium genomosp. 1]KGQ51888.1 LOG family protein [Gallibacterium anatis 10672-6]WIM85200.1 nucleotide 5'-monophosphate nucleosidase PpnN [Gallibacterium anatis]
MSIYYINPRGSMDQLSHLEVARLKQGAEGDLYPLYRNCSLAVLNSGAITDDSRALLGKYPDFAINLLTRERGIALELLNPPESAFVDDKIIRNIQYHLFAVLRDIIFVQINQDRFLGNHLSQADMSAKITNQVFSILRNAKALRTGEDPNLVVCWGGHSINETEYQYCRAVGLELGYRELNIVTGCGPGVMEAPMKGAAIGHFNQRYKDSRFIGITEPSIIASEPPNPIVNELIIMPDIEKRLEAFTRLGHTFLIFPGGPGTFEEFLFLLGIKLHPDNRNQTIPLILTGPSSCADYFATIDRFVSKVLGEEARKQYEIIIDDPVAVARYAKQAMDNIKQQRFEKGDAYSFNWMLKIDPILQAPFEPNHQSMAALNLHLDQPLMDLVSNLRRAFSGIVAGNIKPNTKDAIAKYGAFKLHGDAMVLENMENLLKDFIAQHRMKLPSTEAYVPCYEIVK